LEPGSPQQKVEQLRRPPHHLLFFIGVAEDDDVVITGWSKELTVEVAKEFLRELLIPQGVVEEVTDPPLGFSRKAHPTETLAKAVNEMRPPTGILVAVETQTEMEALPGEEEPPLDGECGLLVPLLSSIVNKWRWEEKTESKKWRSSGWLAT
jgi:hypothetical protein